jgi:hypothetical protein
MSDEKYPVTWSIIDLEFQNAYSDRLYVSIITERNAPYENIDPGFRAFIFTRLESFLIDAHFLYFKYRLFCIL